MQANGLHSGNLYPFIPPAYWRDRILLAATLHGMTACPYCGTLEAGGRHHHPLSLLGVVPDKSQDRLQSRFSRDDRLRLG